MTNGVKDTEDAGQPVPQSPGSFDSFADLLRFYRVTYGERIQRRHPDGPQIKLTALGLIECLRKKGYPITSGTYSEIEAGSNFPRDAKAFLETVASCLGLDGEDYRALVHYLAYDIVRARLGTEKADLTVKRSLPRWLRSIQHATPQPQDDDETRSDSSQA